jgi:PIN domain nuclease of toxin-antitoxin system
MMLLLDTHVLIWMLQNAPQLSTVARSLLTNPAHHKWFSIVSCWELAIKVGTGKLQLGESVYSLLSRELPKNNLQLLPISLAHATAVETLPHHHRDPFDRLLAVQAQLEGMSLISADPIFDQYGVTRLW